MKLQLALDDITLDDAVELLDKVHTYVDIIEVGSPFIIEEGMSVYKGAPKAGLNETCKNLQRKISRL